MSTLKQFEESLRYDYPLDRNSMVIDAGAHVGEFATTLFKKYGCNILSFEPIKEFYDQLVNNIKCMPGVLAFNSGLGATDSIEKFKVKGVMSGQFAEGPEEMVKITGICGIISAASVMMPVALLKLNVEGGEYAIMDAILDAGLATSILNLQIQFHSVTPDCRIHRDRIRERLSDTHQLTYDEPWVWEGWTLK
jgi:FkbM family methyltransferase